MIAYKFVIKKKNKYYPLINYGIDRGRKIKCPAYELNHFYNTPRDMSTGVINNGIGYHFFTKPSPEWSGKYKTIKEWWENFLTKVNKKEISIIILKCKINNFIWTKRKGQIIANEFKILEEINLK